MNVLLTISCNNCCKNVTAFIMPDEKNYYLSYGIENESNDFECSANNKGSMKVTCSCGNDINICL